MNHSSTGTIIYDPYRAGMKSKTAWWCVVEVDPEITRYYRWWVWRKHGIELCEPSWNAHISVIRGEKPQHDLLNLWKKYHRQKITFDYMHHPRWAGDKEDNYNHHWFVEINSPMLVDIRKEFNMPYNWKLHLSIGRTY